MYEGRTAAEPGIVFGHENILCGYELDGCSFVLKDGLPIPTGEDGTDINFEIISIANASLGEHKQSKIKGRLPDFDLSIVTDRIHGKDNDFNRAKALRGFGTMGTFKKGKGLVNNLQ